MSYLNTIFRRMLLLVFIAYGFSNALADETYKRFGIMSALESELRLLLSQATVHETFTIGNVDYHLATLQWKCR